jgi:hypothetical protein
VSAASSSSSAGAAQFTEAELVAAARESIDSSPDLAEAAAYNAHCVELQKRAALSSSDAPARRALVICALQNDFAEGGLLPSRGAVDAVRAVNALRSAAAFDEVVLVTYSHAKGAFPCSHRVASALRLPSRRRVTGVQS